MLAIFAYGACCLAINTEAEFGDDAHCPEHAKSVLAEAVRRYTDGSDQFVLYVLLTVVWINDVSFIVVERDGVNGEVAAREVLGQRGAELYPVGTPLIRILRLGAVGSDLNDGDPLVR